jgi:hypothetical protein
VETPSFTFRLEGVRTVRERAEKRAREELSNELRVRAAGEALLQQATDAAIAARDHSRRELLTAAARDRQAIDKLKERQKAEHDAEWARKSQNTLDELALAVHRRGGALAA